MHLSASMSYPVTPRLAGGNEGYLTSNTKAINLTSYLFVSQMQPAIWPFPYFSLTSISCKFMQIRQPTSETKKRPGSTACSDPIDQETHRCETHRQIRLIVVIPWQMSENWQEGMKWCAGRRFDYGKLFMSRAGKATPLGGRAHSTHWPQDMLIFCRCKLTFIIFLALFTLNIQYISPNDFMTSF